MPKPFEQGHADVKDFFAWINERHRIYVKRFLLCRDAPWSDDPIFQNFKFTNVFRELDRGTFALREMCHDWGDDLGLLVFNICWYRLFNLDTHATDIGWVESFDELAAKMNAKSARREKMFTSAHMTMGKAGEPKVATTLRSLSRIWDERQIIAEACSSEDASLEFLFSWMRQYECIGPFISYEIVSDFRWYPLLEDAPDILSWANVGPGCKRGLERLGMHPDVRSIQHLYSIAPLHLAEWVIEHYVLGNANPMWPPFEMREIEHSLCEFDKYARVARDEGRCKSRFNGEGE